MTTYISVPVTQTVQRCYTTMVQEAHTRNESFQVAIPVQRVVDQTYQVQVPVYHDVQRQYSVCVPVSATKTEQYTVMVPHFETRQGARTVTQCVAVQEFRTQCVDRGHWEDREVACSSGCASTGCGGCGGCASSGCGSCAPAATCCATAHVRTWVPNVVQQQVPCTVMKPHCVQVPYTYQVQVCTPDVRTRTFQVCSYHQEVRTATERVCDYRCETRVNKVTVTECSYEQRTRVVPYTVCVPKTETRNEQVTTYECRAVPKTETYTVMVPQTVQKQIEVEVCHMVPQTVQVPCQAELPAELRRLRVRPLRQSPALPLRVRLLMRCDWGQFVLLT